MGKQLQMIPTHISMTLSHNVVSQEELLGGSGSNELTSNNKWA